MEYQMQKNCRRIGQPAQPQAKPHQGVCPDCPDWIGELNNLWGETQCYLRGSGVTLPELIKALGEAEEFLDEHGG